MKFSLLLGLISSLMFAIITDHADAEGFDSHYKGLKVGLLDVTELLKNPKVFEGYSDCLLDKSSCSRFGQHLKDVLPDVIAIDCRKCTGEQKNALIEAFHFLQTRRPHIYRELLRKYDPHGEFQIRHQLFN